MRFTWMALGLVGLSGCKEDVSKDNTFYIGSILSQTGALSGIGLDMQYGAELAIAEINAAGGLNGKTVALRNYDDGSGENDVDGEPTRASQVAEQLVGEGVPAVLGAIGSGNSLEVMSVLGPAGVVQVSPSSTSPAFTTDDADGYFFRTCPSDALQGQLMAQRSLERGHQTAAVIHVEGAYGEGMAAAFAEAFEAGGGTITWSGSYEGEQSDYVDLLDEVFASPPDALALPAYPVDGAQIVSDYLDRYADSGTMFFFADALANDTFKDAVGAGALAGLDHEGTVPTWEGDEYADFAAAFSAAYGSDPGPFVSNAYDAIYLIGLSIAAAGSTDGSAIAAEMAGVSEGGTAFGPGQFEAAAAAISAGEDVDYVGASGQVNFDSSGDVVAPYHIWTFDSSGELTITFESQLPE